ncbi:MAG: glycerophosphodiester phosphodiesterase family protein [Arenicellales bacterium]
MTGRADELTLVGHRGYPAAFPENTLLGFQQAVVHGASYVETDVQSTRDGVPVLYHDAATERISGVSGTILARTLDEVGVLSAHHPGRFGSRFEGTPVPTLRAFATWLAQHPTVTAFVEIKGESLEEFGVEPMMRAVMEAIETVRRRCVIISFDDQCVAHTQARYEIRTGWVLPHWNRRTESRARELSPDFLFAEDVQVPARATGIWRGPWQWAVYVINDVDAALTYVERGIHLVETDAIGSMRDQLEAAGAVQ